MILQLLIYFTLWTVALTALFEAYACLLRRMASLPSKFSLLFGYALYCVIGGVIFVLPILGFELILGHDALPTPNKPLQITIAVFATLYGSPTLAYWFFHRRHMATLKALGYFLPIKLQSTK